MESTVSQQPKLAFLTKNSDILVSFGVIGILIIMILPMPTWLLDILLAFNITFSVVVILVSMYVVDSLEISIFPTHSCRGTSAKWFQRFNFVLKKGNAGK